MSKTWSPEKRPPKTKDLRALYETTCSTAGGKRCYPTKVQARKARTRIDRRLNIYRCDACSGYHLGHLPRAITAGHISRAEAYGA